MSDERVATFGAAVLASGGPDKLAKKLGVPHKALIELAGKPMIEYVTDALVECPELERVVVVAHEAGAAPHLKTDLAVVQPQGESYMDAIAAAADALSDMDYVLICTCDVPMLTAEAAGHFVQSCRSCPSADLAYSIVKASVAQSGSPEMQRTVVKLVEASFVSGCMAAMTRRFVDENIERLGEVFAQRKSKIGLGRLLGWPFVGKLLLKKLSLVAVVKRAEELLGCEVLVVISPHPCVGFDVDKVSDVVIARRWAVSR